MLKLRIKQDDSAENPREAFDHVATFVCWHRRGKYGDEQPREQPCEWLESFQAENPNAIVMPLYMYEHSGVTIRTEPFGDPWDSGQLGFAYVTFDKARKELCGDMGATIEHAQELARACILAEVAEYDAYLRGDVWGYELVKVETCDHGDEHEEHVDSCWGFIGDSKEVIADHLPDEARGLVDAAWDSRGA
jgi:hypothetical protein